jgi:hypothetical protein
VARDVNHIGHVLEINVVVSTHKRDFLGSL